MKGGRLYVNLPNNVDQSVAVGSYHKNSPVYSRTNPDCKAPRWSVPCRSPAHQTKEIASVFRSEEHTSDSSHRTISYAVFCLKKKNLCIYHTIKLNKTYTIKHNLEDTNLL